MAEFNIKRVILNSSPEFNIKLSSKPKFKIVAATGGVQVPARFQDLTDFDNTNVNDKYVIMYNGATGKYEMVNPDEVLNAAAATETLQPGLVGFATAFLDRVDTDLDNRIDIDAGMF